MIPDKDTEEGLITFLTLLVVQASVQPPSLVLSRVAAPTDFPYT